MRVIREQAAAQNALKGICDATAELLEELVDSLRESWHENRAAVRDLIEQIMALCATSAVCPDNGALTHRLIRLRLSAIVFLSLLRRDQMEAFIYFILGVIVSIPISIFAPFLTNRVQ
jgi:hypothetical protein